MKWIVDCKWKIMRLKSYKHVMIDSNRSSLICHVIYMLISSLKYVFYSSPTGFCVVSQSNPIHCRTNAKHTHTSLRLDLQCHFLGSCKRIKSNLFTCLLLFHNQIRFYEVTVPSHSIVFSLIGRGDGDPNRRK